MVVISTIVVVISVNNILYPAGITTVLTIVTMTNSIRATAPKARSFRSLDYYMMLCLMFVISAMGVYALVGMSDPKSKRKWLLEKEKKERRMAEVAEVCFRFDL